MNILPNATPRGENRVVDLATHRSVHGERRVCDLLDALQRSGLRGRGGAGRLVAPELAAVRAEVSGSGRPGVVVVNGVEGEPLSRKDATLLATVPHLVLDGALAAAQTVGASDVIVCTAAGPGFAGVTVAVAERAGQDPVRFHVAAAAAGFVAGQDTAVVAHLDGFAARPRGNGVPIARSGVAGRPTLVKNVETLARTGFLAAHGHVPATLLLTLALPSGPRVVEVDEGTALATVLAGHDAGAGVLLGGFHGRWVGADDLAAPLELTGSGVVRPIATGECPLVVAAAATRFLAEESVRQCGPCTFGLPRLADLVDALAGCTLDAGGLHALRRTLGMLGNRGACRHPDASARSVVDALVTFEPEVRAHALGICTAARAVAA